MNCLEFGDIIGALAAGKIPEPLRAAAEEHALSCPRCARLLALARGEEQGTEADDALTAGILRRTSGAVCESIADRLCGWADGDLAGADEALVSEHLDHCAGCRALASTIRNLHVELPAMAEIEPDVRFTLDVLERTSRRRDERPSFVAALGGLWARLAQRPRIAQEIAYCAAIVIFTIGGLRYGGAEWPGTRTPDQGTVIGRAAGGFAQGGEVIAGMLDRLAGEIESGRVGSAPVPGRIESVSRGAKRSGKRVVRTLDLVAECGGRIGGGLKRWDSIEIWGAIRDLREGIRNCWSDSSRTEPSPESARIPSRRMDQRRNGGGNGHVGQHRDVADARGVQYESE